MNKKVTVTYLQSAAGQRAALIAGRDARNEVKEEMELTDTALLDKITIAPDGSLFYDASKGHPSRYSSNGMYFFDAPPTWLGDVINTVEAHRAAIDIVEAAMAAKKAAKEEADRLAAEAKAVRDAPMIEAVLAELEALPLLDPIPDLIVLGIGYYPELLYYKGMLLSPLTAPQKARLVAVIDRRAMAAEEDKEAKRQAIEAAREAKIAEHGGHWWKAAPMCGFRGYNLWRDGQTKRWVGIFSKAKGIDSFLTSPRGEFVFDTSELAPGDCIQGAGYDTNSRGKRRDECEWFGVVRRNDETGLVVEIMDSRSACLLAAKTPPVVLEP